MSFSATLRNFAVAPELVAELFPNLLGAFGEASLDGLREIVTIGEHPDNASSTRTRAASLHDGTIPPQSLTDGRVGFRFLPQADLEEEFLTNGIPGVEELTDEQFKALLPPPPEMP